MLRSFLNICRSSNCLPLPASLSTATSTDKHLRIPPTGMTITPYAYFVKEKFVKSEKKTADTFKELSIAWKGLGQPEKKAYKEKSEKYREDKIREFLKLSEGEQKMKIEESMQSKAERAKRKDRKARREEWENTNHPELPPNAYALFIQESMKELKASGKTLLPVQEHVKEFAQQWKNLAEEKKAKYNEKAETLRKDYHASLEEWKRKQKETKAESKKIQRSVHGSANK